MAPTARRLRRERQHSSGQSGLVGHRHIHLRFLFIERNFFSQDQFFECSINMLTLTESTLTKRMHTAHLHDVIAPRRRIITEIEVLFFDEEQIHHGDEPYTYTNLTEPNLCIEYVLGQCVSLIKSTR